MYGKIFETMYDGSLVENWEALVTFQQLIVLCNSDGIVDMTHESLSRRTGIPIEIIRKGIEILESPDPRSRTPDDDGRRIRLLDGHRDWGWYLVNHVQYRDQERAADKRTKDRERMQRKRNEAKGLSKVAPRRISSRTVAPTDSRCQIADNNPDPVSPPTAGDTNSGYCEDFETFWQTYPPRSGRRRGKAKTYTLWKKVRSADRQALLIAARNYRSEEFIKDPERFLKDDYWRDFVDEAESVDDQATTESAIWTEIRQHTAPLLGEAVQMILDVAPVLPVDRDRVRAHEKFGQLGRFANDALPFAERLIKLKTG